jgi:hypothetical protein
MAENNIHERFVGLHVRVKEVEQRIREADMHTHYELKSTVYAILDNAISTCHTVLNQAKNTIMDCQEKIKESKQEQE